MTVTATAKHTGTAVRRRTGGGGSEATGSATRGTAQDPRSDQTSRCADEDEGILFGGPVGTGCIVVASHIIVLYLYYVNRVAGGALVNPWTGSHGGVSGMVFTALAHGNLRHAAAAYASFLVLQSLLYVWGPGIVVKGRPLRHRNGEQLEYHCNGVFALAVTNTILIGGHWLGVLRLGWMMDNLGALVIVSMAAGDLVSLAVYVGAIVTGEATRMTGSHVYDFFMGAWLNPRIGTLDLKMLAETRLAWMGVFYVTAGAAAKQYELYGTVSPSMCLMVLAHGLYVNACMKGEECVPTTWDIFFEKWHVHRCYALTGCGPRGWHGLISLCTLVVVPTPTRGFMLIFWNLSGVPFAYSFQSVYLLAQGTEQLVPTPVVVGLGCLLVVAYYIWDTANSQKNRMRMMEAGTYVPRPWAIPQLPWGTLHNPKVISTKAGTKLLVDGWYKYARKIHYSADICMAFIWGLCCGVKHFLPYFYVCFFTSFLVSRTLRDDARCRKKYGADWDRYCRVVPYKFLPGIV